MPVSIDTAPAAVHEFRIPPKALLGLHSYCPVHFDSFHAVLIDLSIHIVLLKAANHSPPQKVPRFVSTLVFFLNGQFPYFGDTLLVVILSNLESCSSFYAGGGASDEQIDRQGQVCDIELSSL